MLQLRAAAVSDIGYVRRDNEDRFFCDPDLRLFGVADGVGGLPGGGEAAQAAHDSVLAACRSLPPGREPDLFAMVGEANAAVEKLGRVVSPVAGIATTLTFGV